MHHLNKTDSSRGFTLVEMMIAVTVFAVVATRTTIPPAAATPT
jgi:prepilin-type N-terminal cleavage/methylation domain-containing protein